jgi:hypothetical protein
MRVSRLCRVMAHRRRQCNRLDHKAATAIRDWYGLTALAGQASGTFGR